MTFTVAYDCVSAGKDWADVTLKSTSEGYVALVAVGGRFKETQTMKLARLDLKSLAMFLVPMVGSTTFINDVDLYTMRRENGALVIIKGTESRLDIPQELEDDFCGMIKAANRFLKGKPSLD